jgi:hypothetical protein
MSDNRAYKLTDGGTLAIVPGPYPYLWLGDSEGFYVGSTKDTDQLRRIHRAIGKALDKANIQSTEADK